MGEPLSIAAVGTKLFEASIGALFLGGCKRGWNRLRHGPPYANHDIPRAVREAWGHALRGIVASYTREHDRDVLPGHRAALNALIEAATREEFTASLFLDTVCTLDLSGDPLPAMKPERLAPACAAIARELRAMLQTSLDPRGDVPQSFDVFVAARLPGALAYYYAEVVIKPKDEKACRQVMWEIAQATDVKIDAMLELMRRVEEKIDRRHDEAAADRQVKHDETGDMLREILSRLPRGPMSEADKAALRAEVERELTPLIEARLRREMQSASVSEAPDVAARRIVADLLSRLSDSEFIEAIRRGGGGPEAVATSFDREAMESARQAEAHLRAAQAHIDGVVEASIKAYEWHTIAGNVQAAADSLDNALRLRRTDVWVLIYRARAALALGDLRDGERHLQQAQSVAGASDRDRLVVFSDLGDMRMAQGDLPGALEAYQAAMEIAVRLAASDPKNTDWQRDLSMQHDRIGNARRSQGDWAEADQAYQHAKDIRQRLAASDSRNNECQRDLSVSHTKIGDMRLAQGDLAEALEAYEAAVEIAARLAASGQKNTQWQRDVAVGYARVAAVTVRFGDTDGARTHFQTARAIMARLVALDPRNAQWKRDLAILDAALAALSP